MLKNSNNQDLKNQNIDEKLIPFGIKGLIFIHTENKE